MSSKYLQNGKIIEVVITKIIDSMVMIILVRKEIKKIKTNNLKILFYSFFLIY